MTVSGAVLEDARLSARSRSGRESGGGREAFGSRLPSRGLLEGQERHGALEC